MFIANLRDALIKMLGGYTPKEQERLAQRYQAMLDSKTDNTCTQIVNEYLYRTFRDLVSYARKELYGLSAEVWANKFYNILNNNMYRILIRYLNTNSATIYRLDTTLDKHGEFKRILEEDNNQEALELLNKQEFS